MVLLWYQTLDKNDLYSNHPPVASFTEVEAVRRVHGVELGAASASVRTGVPEHQPVSNIQARQQTFGNDNVKG